MFKHLLLCSNAKSKELCSNIYYCVQILKIKKLCSTFIIVFKHLLSCSNIKNKKSYVQTFIIVFKHLLLCSNIYYCVQTFIIVFKYLLLCSNIYYYVQMLKAKNYVQTFII